MNFQERFQQALKDSDYTQKEIAAKLHIDPANVTNWKQGKNVPSVQTLYDLCVLLNVSADYLLGLDDVIEKW